VTIADVAPDILAGPFDDALRAELRRQLDELGVELRLGVKLPELPAVEPARLGEVAAGDLRADIWFRAFGVVPETAFLSHPKDERGYVEVDEFMRVAGEERVYAIGDASNLDRNMAGMAGRQAEQLGANLRAQLTGEGEIEPYVSLGAVIAVPLGPEGGAGQFPGMDGIAGPELVADIKGRDMLVERSASLFDALAPAEVLA
jgi:NADH dehydrogenase FAD-containing subunit